MPTSRGFVLLPKNKTNFKLITKPSYCVACVTGWVFNPQQNMYLDHKTIREFEESNGYKTIIDKNIQIGKFLGFEPEIEWMVGTNESSCFHPKSCGYNDTGSQKVIAEKWLNEQKEKHPNGWVIKEGNQVVKREYFPNFHTDWNHLMECVKRLKLLGVEINIFSDNIFQTWYEVSQHCL